MPLPWQHTCYHCQNMCLSTSTPQGKHLCQISWELVKNWGSSSRRKIFPPIYCHNSRHTMATRLFPPLSKNVSCTSTPQGKHLCQHFMRISVKNWAEVVRDARFISPIFAIICRYHGNTLSTTVKKCVLRHLRTPRQNLCHSFHENWWKTEEVVRDARFFPIFSHNMLLAMATHFATTVKKCVLHIYTPRQTSVPTFHEN